ncbi:MinD/ParA family ATP-binding protein [Kitasatospora kifunensis]|uniref:MinD-like ATPase involved in chromosome partitioning or flagellar assembly n=1 Tax=Kitasatospora kifunensis TaxID=58351 RepID=A0A7W7VXK5_KITKI|nr:hypothetical protein [Kitasatospora kifunensis]MBB4926053.1 MinD-like ATPase involved in chromosome partitioning or flagellar assembly [Kitasatospora kifunensis]
MTVLSDGVSGMAQAHGSGGAGWAAGAVGSGGAAQAGPAAVILRLGPDAGRQDAPDYTPACWPEAVTVIARTPLDPLGTVLIPPPQRALLNRAVGAEPGALPTLTPAPPLGALPLAAPPLGAPPLGAAAPAVGAPTVGAPAEAPARVIPEPDRSLGRAAAQELSSERLLRRAASRGQRALRRPFAGGGQEEQRRLLESIRTPLHSCHRIAVLGHPARSGQTAVTLALGTLLATHRPDRVIAVDLAAPQPAAVGAGAGEPALALGDRVRRESARTLGDLLAVLPSLSSYQQLRAFTSRATSGLEVLAELPGAAGTGFDEYGYRQVLSVLSSQYPVVLSDTGTAADGVRQAATELADQLVICASASVAGADGAAGIMDRLVAQGQGELVRDAVTVVSAIPTAEGGRPLPAQELAAHFRTRCRGVVVIPADNHLAAGGELDPARLRPKTRQACLELAALVGESMARHRPAGAGVW